LSAQNTFAKIKQQISNKIGLIMLAALLISHLTIMIFYLQANRIASEDVRRDAIIQKIMNAIHIVKASPQSYRAKAVAAMADPVVHASLSKKPLFSSQFTDSSLWNISENLQRDVNKFSLSIEFEKNQWLNLKANITSHLLLDQLLILSAEIIVFGAIFMFVWSINRFTKPLKKFKKAAEQLGIDLHTKPLDIYGPQVVREAALALNKMQGRIQDLIRDRTQILAAISHDLRTPITRMRIRAQFVNEQSLQDNITHDLEEMEQMINETLSFARADANMESKVQMDLVSLVQTICEDMQDMGHDVTFFCRASRIPFFGRSLALKRAFTNLINNGIRYGKRVQVNLTMRGKQAFIKVEDDGPGIPQEEMEHVFSPFYRGEHSRSRDTGGVGLGLAVTKDIIQAHSGKIRLHNKKPHGLRVSVYL
jgi:signal transduction histidine kinase